MLGSIQNDPRENQYAYFSKIYICVYTVYIKFFSFANSKSGWGDGWKKCEVRA